MPMQALIPAGGLAERFGGIYKELLPIDNSDFLLKRAIDQAVNVFLVNEVTILSNVDKISTHANFVHRYFPDLKVKYQLSDNWDNLWHAIYDTLDITQDTILILPDTYVKMPANFNPWGIMVGAPITLGQFMTDDMSQYSAFDPVDGYIRTKDPLLADVPGYAWGLVYWNPMIANYWKMHPEMRDLTYDQAFQSAMDIYGYWRFDIEEYYDLGTWERYEEFINRGQPE